MYRLRQYDEFSNNIKNMVSSNLPLRFHGCPIYTARQIISDGEISSSVDRLGVSTSYDVEDQVSVTTIDTVDTTVKGYAKLVGDYTLPAGCIFVLLPKDENDALAGQSMLMQNVDFKAEPERLIGIITTPENISIAKSWAQENGVDTSKICEYDNFIDLINQNNKKTTI